MQNLSFGAIKAGGQHFVLMGIFMEFINLDITANVLLVLHYIYSMKLIKIFYVIFSLDFFRSS